MSDGDFNSRLLADEDQVQAGLTALAKRLGTFRLQLFAAGFSEEQTWGLEGARDSDSSRRHARDRGARACRVGGDVSAHRPLPPPSPLRRSNESDEDYSLRCKAEAFVRGDYTVEEYEDAVDRVLRFYREGTTHAY